MTNRPIVTATYERGLESMGVGGSTIHVQPGVTVEVTFPLHDHEAALAALDRAVADVWSQIDTPERPAGEHPDEALAQTIADAFYEGDSYDAARAAREYIDHEPDDALVDSSQQVRATRAEAERDWWRDAARRHVAERGEAEEELVELVDERDEWKARHAALRADVERVRRNRTTLTDVLMCIADVLDRDDERGQA